jgi:hypothetical protein
MLSKLVARGNFLVGYPGFVFRRQAWATKGGVDESLRIASDLDLLAWLFQQGDVALIPVVGYLRRVHDTNATRNHAAMKFEVVRVISRLVMTAPSLRAVPNLVSTVNAWILDSAYWLRESHNYREAADLYRLWGKLEGGRLRTSMAIGKLTAHRVMSTALRRAPKKALLSHLPRLGNGDEGVHAGHALASEQLTRSNCVDAVN